MKFTEWKETNDKYYRGEERKECTHLYSELLPMINELNHKLGWLVLSRVQVRNLYSKENKIDVDTDWKQYEEDEKVSLNISYLMCTSKGAPTGVIVKSNQEKEKFMFVGMSEIQSWRISDRNNYIESVKWSKLCKKLIARYDTNLIPTYAELMDYKLMSQCKELQKIKGSDKNLYDLANRTRFDDRKEGKVILEHLLHPKTYPMTETFRAELQQKLDDVEFANKFEQRQKDNESKLASQSFWIIGKDNLSSDIHFVTKAKFVAKDSYVTTHSFLEHSNFIIEEDTQGYLDLNEHKDSDTIIPRLTLWSMIREEYIKTRGMSVDESIASYTLRDRKPMYSEKASIIACSTNNKLANQEWVLLFNDKE